MRQKPASWSRELARMFLLYLAVGAAFIPSGVVYALLRLAGWDHWLLAGVLLGTGFLTAHFVWVALGTRKAVKGRQVFHQTFLGAGEAESELSKQREVIALIGEFNYYSYTSERGPSPVIKLPSQARPGTTARSQTILL